ncbi:hypothetical protein ACFWVP_17480 [Streptomyces sp. NPDC058637]|uniref:hypothetical protein n=1 Tax=Streptomyces sp. NPDC058637 TaxID=3346569 RepID=UPI00365F1CC5
MTRWVGLFARRRGDRSPAPTAPAAAAPTAEGPDDGAAEELLVEDHAGLLLLRTPTDDDLTPADIADLAHGMREDEGTVTVIAGAEGMRSTAFWPRLSELLDSLSESGADTVRLVMTGAGHDVEDRPATARQIADAWGLEVRAPDGPTLVVPGGSLYVPPVDGRPSGGGWWRFAPGAEPEPLGPRSPEPSWQPALRGVPSGTAGGSVVEQIPAGLLVRPAGATPTQPGDLYHAVPIDPRHPAVVIGVPFGEDVSADEVAEVLTALPEGVRSDVRLAPGGRRDLLPLAQSVSDRLDTDVQVMTGLPLVAAAGPLGAYSVRSVLAAPDGTPKWIPFVDAVVCRPPDGKGRARPPRLLRWAPPVQGPARPEEGVIGLTDRWQVTVTRAGLWVGPSGGPQLSSTERPVDANGPVIDLGVPGELMDPSLWPALSGLLAALTPALRQRATLHVHGVSQDGGRELRRLAAQHGLRTLRHATPASAPTRTDPPARTQLRHARTAAPETASASTSAPASVPVTTGGAPPSTMPVRGPQESEQPAQSGRSGLPLRPLQPGRTSGSVPGEPAEGAGRAARVERVRQLREAMAAGTSAAADASASASTGAPGRASGRAPGSGAAGGRDGLRSFAAPGEPAAASGQDGRAEVLDWPDDPVATGSPRRSGSSVAAGGPAKRREPVGRTGTPEGDDARNPRRATPAADEQGEDPVRAALPDPDPEAGTGPGAMSEPGSAGPNRPATGPVHAGGSVRGSEPEASEPDTSGPDAVGGPVTADGPERTIGAGTGDGTGTADGPARTGDPEGVGGADVPGGPPQAAEPVGAGPEADGTVPAAEPEPHGTTPRTSRPEATAGDGEDDGSASSGADEPQEDGPAADRSEPSSAQGPAVEPTGSPRQGGTGTPGRLDDVPSPRPMRVESGAPADPPPAPAETDSPGTARGGADETPTTPDATTAPDAPETDAAPDTPGIPDVPATVGESATADDSDVPRAPLPPVPLDIGHRSSEAERTAFRALAGGMWDRHGAAVARSLARMPALRGKEQEAARADLIALRMSLHISEGPLSHGAVTRALREYEPDMLPYGACVASALNRLPSYRGALLRGMGSDPTAEGSPALPRPGTLLRDAAQLSTTPFDSTRTATMPGGTYVIWSVSGRRVRQLSDHARGPDEVVFAPGTLFRVLDVRRDGRAVQLFLRELTGPPTATTPDPDADRAVLARLDDAVRGSSAAPVGTGHWPDRCVGAVGAGP